MIYWGWKANDGSVYMFCGDHCWAFANISDYLSNSVPTVTA